MNNLPSALSLKVRRAEALLALPVAAETLSEHDFMQYGQELAEQFTGSQIAFIHLVHDDQKTIELVAWSRATLATYCTAAYDTHYPVDKAGIWAAALHQRQPVVFNDYASASGKRGLPEGHARLNRLISVPVIESGLVRMMCGVGNKPELYTETDVETVRLISDAIWRIVRQRRAEAALRASGAFQQAILNSVSAEIAVLDENGIILAVNQPWQRFAIENSLQPGTPPPGTGIGANYLAACQASEGLIAASALSACEGIRAVLSGQSSSFRLEYPCHSPQKQRWFSMRVTPLGHTAQGGVVIVHTDITERKLQQQHLQLVAQIFAQGREGIMVTDAEANIVMVNQAFSQITGYTEAEVLGKNPRLLHSDRQGPDFYRTLWHSLTLLGHWSGEIWNRKKDASIYPEWLTISALHDEQNKVVNYVANFSNLSETKAAESRIQWLSHFDTLTGLPNRTLLEDRTTMAMSMAQRAEQALAMMLVAIDHLSSVNDTLGHQAGDQLLIEVARRLSDSVREQDTVARLGGKEFVLLLPGTDSVGAAHLATQLLSQLAQPCTINGNEINVTASIGLVNFPDNGDNFEVLFKAVEIAMHRAQEKGRNTYQFYSTELYTRVLERDAMIKALHQAIGLHQFQLVYQPQVDLQKGQVCGLEALLRWTHPELGAVSPTQFITLAEEAGLIIDIGKWVLQQTCQDVRRWLDLGLDVPHVAVNASPLQFRDNDFVAQVAAAIKDANIDPSLICVEVTESALMDDVPGNEAMLKSLKSLGVKLSLDDFGTGYSSLSYLKRFPFDQVKIDQSFVRDIATNPSDHMLVGVIVSMAHGFGMKAIAEGVETESQCNILRNSICDEIQGYFFSRPLSAQATEVLLAQGSQLPAHLLHAQKPQRTLLLVDDEPNIVSALKRLFRRDGYVILTAHSGTEGLALLANHKVDIIVSDQRMPGMTGVEFLRQAKTHYPDTIRIVLSGYTELQSVTDAINEGSVYRFLTKPWDDELLRAQIQKAIAYKSVLEENRELDIKVRTSNRELVAANRQLGRVLQQLQQQIALDETGPSPMTDASGTTPLEASE